MHPVLLKLGPLTIHTYGFFIAIGFVTAIFIAKNESIKVHIDPEVMMDLCFYMLISGLIGARIFYVIIEWDTFSNNLLEIFKIWHGGLVFFGGFIFSMFFCFFYVKKYKIDFLKTVDILAPCIAIAHAFGRLGCFSAGCCYGKACDLPWAVTFTHPQTLALQNTPLHPVQIYSAFMNLFIFIVLMYYRRSNKIDGMISVLYLFMYGIGRFLVEFFRGDDRGTFVFNAFSPAQFIGIMLIILSFILYIILKKKNNYSRYS